MLEDGEIENIKKLINLGKSNYKIGKELGHSANTIKKIREELKNSKLNHTIEEETHFDDPIEEFHRIEQDIGNLIEKGNLRARELKKWEKRFEEIRELLRTEVDNRIASERSKAIEEIDNVWNKHIEQNYVQKDVATDLNNMLKAKEATIESLNYAIDQKDGVLATTRQENEGLKNRISNILWKKVDLEKKTGDLSEFIENHLDDAGRREREKLVHEKTEFDRHAQKQKSELDNMCFENDTKFKAAENKESELNKREENIKKQQQELKTTWKRISEIKNNLEKRQEDIDNQRENIKERWEAVLKTSEELRTEEQQLQKWQTNLEKTGGFNKFSLTCPNCKKPMLFDASKPEIYQKIKQTFGNYTHTECKPKSKQQKHVILHPVSLSGETVIQSGFSPIVQSGLEMIVVECSGEPVIRSGISPIIKSDEELDVFVPIGEPVFQSGVST